MNKISLASLKDLFFKIFLPESCINCGENGQTICNKCLKEIQSRKIKNKNIENIDWIRASLDYKNLKLKSCLFFLKYHHTKSVATYLASIIYLDVLKLINEIQNKNNTDYKNILIIPIPISKKRLVERDYNQSELILKATIEEIKNKENVDLKQNILKDLLIKNKHTIKFADTHSSSEREYLIKDAFIINERYKNNFLENKTIIIFDDITTTGTTFYEARNTLISSGAKKENIFGYAVAH